MAMIETIRLVVALASGKGWPLIQLDVKSAFLNGPLEEIVYVSQPPGFLIKGSEDKVYKLNKALYGLKQAPRAWNKRIDSFLTDNSFVKCTVEHGIYVKILGDGKLLLLCLYVDDLLITGNNMREIEGLKSVLMAEFEMSDLGRLSYFLGLEFVNTNKGILLHQKKYGTEVLKRFEMEGCNAATTPIEVNVKLKKEENDESVDGTLFKQIVGSLRYLCHSRPDLCYSVGLISRFMNNPKRVHLLAAKRILRYLSGTLDYGVLFPYESDQNVNELLGFSDSDWSGDEDERKSTTGYLFKFLGASISWCSKKQPVVALSTCEAEYIASSYAACQVIWLESVLKDLMIQVHNPIKLMVDNKSAIDLAKNPVSHGRSKHIETRFHFLRDQVNRGKLEMVYCHTSEQIADALTKPLKKDRFEELRELMGVVSLKNLN